MSGFNPLPFSRRNLPRAGSRADQLRDFLRTYFPLAGLHVWTARGLTTVAAANGFAIAPQQVRSILHDLERQQVVRRIDNQRPPAWTLTEKGAK